MKLQIGSALVAGALSALAVAVVVSAQSGSTSAAANDSLFAALKGADKDGRGSFSATFDGNKLCFGLAVKNLDKPVAAHIHKGGKGVDGPVAITLAFPKSGTGGSGGCVSATAGQRSDVLKKPGGFYVNVHTGDNPNGAIRGQLFSKTPS